MRHYLSDDIFVPQETAAVTSVKELSLYVNRVLCCCTDDAESVVLVLASLAYFTFEAFFLIFPVYNNSIPNAVNRLVKRGYLKENPFPKFDSMSKKYFSITSAGHCAANSYFLGTIPVRYRYGRRENSAAHIYSTGLNLYAFLSFGLPMTWRREVLLSTGTGTVRKGALQADACVSIWEGTGQERFFYIEQDMGFERDSQLYGKMEKYAAYCVMAEPQDAVIFSFRTKNVSVTKPSRAGTVYSRAGVNSILERLRKHGLTDAGQLPELYPEDGFLREFLIVCGALGENSDGGTVRIPGVIIDETFLKDFKFSLKFHVNGYVLRELNRRQSVLAKNRLAQFVALFYGWMDKGQVQGTAYQMLQGFPVYFMTTSLMCTYGGILMPDRFKFRERMSKTLQDCYGELGGYHMVTPELPLKNGYTVRLRNAFCYMIDGKDCGLVCVEFLNVDLSAWIRLRMFYALYEGALPVHVIAVFDDQKQVSDMYGYLGCYYPELSVVLDRKAVLSCMYSDIGKEGALFTLSDPFGEDARLYHKNSCTYKDLHGEEGP